MSNVEDTIAKLKADQAAQANAEGAKRAEEAQAAARNEPVQTNIHGQPIKKAPQPPRPSRAESGNLSRRTKAEQEAGRKALDRQFS